MQTSHQTSSFAGLGELIRFILRRDRVRIPLWILGIWLSVVGTAATFPSIYPEAADRLGALLTINNPGTTALIGAVYGDGDYTYGIMVGHQLLGLIGITAALMSIFTVVRHTRAEEESGRAELIRSAVVGRNAPTAAALIVVIGANIVLAFALAVGLITLGIETITWQGSLLFGVAVGAVGIVFAAVATVTVQLTENARTASSSAGLILAASYVVRAIGDVSNETISWFSPIGWAQATKTYDANRWAPLLLPLALAVILIGASVLLSRRRDLGAGLLSTRPGPAGAGFALRGPIGLVWRLNRGVITGWGIGLFVFGLMYGPVLSEAETFLQDLPIMAEFLPETEATGAQLFGALVIAVSAILATVPPVQVMLRMRSEETAGRVAPLLSTPLARSHWLISNIVISLLAAVVVLLLTGVGIGLGAGWSMQEWSWVGESTIAALSYLPAVTAVLGLAVLLVGWLPRMAGAAWTMVVFAAVVMYFGGLLNFPQWLMNISPFTHIPQQPAFDFDAVPLVWLAGLSVVLLAIGTVGMNRRDILDT